MRKKLYVEKTMVDKAIATREDLIGKIREFSDHLKSEGILFTKEILHQFLHEGWPAIQKILITTSQQQMKKLKIAGSLISGSMEEQARRISLGFEKHHKRIQEALINAHISINEIMIEKGIPVLTDEEKKEIEEQFTYYLEEEDQELYSKLSAFTNHYNQLFRYLSKKDLGLQTHLTAALSENNHVMVEPGVYELRNDIMFLSEGAVIVEGDDQAEKIVVNPKYFAR